MNEWGVVTVLISLFGFGAAVIKPILSLNSTIVRLTEAVKELNKDMTNFVNDNHKSHVRIHEKIEMNKDKIDEHESRLTRLEVEKKS